MPDVERPKGQIEAEAEKRNENKVNTAIAERLKKARADAGFKTASDAARHFGIVESTYAAHENGSRGIPLWIIRRYAAAFGVNQAWLAFGDEASKSYKLERLEVRFVIQKGIWFELDAMSYIHPEDAETIPVTSDPAFFRGDQFACRIETRIPRIASPGEYLIIMGLATYEHKGQPGDYYLIERARGDMRALAIWSRQEVLESLGDQDPQVDYESAGDLLLRWKPKTMLPEADAKETIVRTGLVIGRYAPKSRLLLPAG